MFILSPSILAADFKNLGSNLEQVEKAGAQYLHIDVMDGQFVPSISFGMPVMQSIRPAVNLFFDVHLMIEDPDRYIEDFQKAGADGITVHAEACRHLDRTLYDIRSRGLRAGVALNPATPLNCLEYVLDKTDMILIMTVNPGFGGQKLIPATLQKLRDLKKMLREHGSEADIEVDGGIGKETLPAVIEAGANVFVAGSAVFGDDIPGNIRELQGIMDRYNSI